MLEQELCETVSRRGRPANPPLSRDVIVATALDLLARDGLAALSLRKVSAALDTGPASLYVYVANLAELHALMLDRALGAVALPGGREGGWRDRLTAVLASYLRVLYDGPGRARLALSTIAVGPHALRLIETLLDLLLEGGIDPAVAAWAVDLLTLHVAAIAAEQDVRRAGGDTFGPVARAIAAAPAADYPHIHALREELLSGGDARFVWVAAVVPDRHRGVRRRLAAVRRRRRPRDADHRPAPAGRFRGAADPARYRHPDRHVLPRTDDPRGQRVRPGLGGFSVQQRLAADPLILPSLSAVATTVYFTQQTHHGAGHAMTVSVAIVGGITLLCLALVWLLPTSAPREPADAP